MLARSQLRIFTLAALLVAPTAARAASSFVTFEAGEVRPLALSPDGTQLFVVDTPDNRLEIFDVDSLSGNLTHSGTVPVGLEPVAVAARTAGEVWVVNHLSDSVSIVDLTGSEPRVSRTLLVGDEPRDIVFAGPGSNRAFITCAHRGQNNPNDPQLTTAGIGRADVWSFDATNLGTSLTGTPLSIVTLFGDTPRALAVSPDGGTVYAAVFESGNQTTALSEGVVCNGGSGAAACTINSVSYPGGLPAPNKSADNVTGPETGLVVKFNATSGHWEDRLARNWDHAVRFFLPDDDVFRIDANANPPAPLSSAPHAGQPFSGVGTVLFNMAVNPMSGKVYVSNGDARNEVRFEGLRPPCASPSSVIGHLSEARITILDPSLNTVTPRHLNSHLDGGPSSYCTVPSPAGTADKSLATPLGMAVTSDGQTLYVAAFGSSDPGNPGTGGIVGVFDTTELENGTFTPSAADHILLSGGGASGVMLNEPLNRLYVLTRFDNAVSVVDTTASPGTEVQHLPVYNPEPDVVKIGRPFLYDATLTSSNGEAACASCHIFGDFDSLAWDLGNPGDVVKANPNPFRNPPGSGGLDNFHPLKGPMTTQTLRGMVNDGPMHWRGDRTGGDVGQPLNSTLAFEAFNVAFPGLLGRSGPLTALQMQEFTEFILEVMLPPNPIRDPNFNGTLTTAEQNGSTFFNSVTSDVVQTCNGCHVLDPANGHFGTDGLSTFENEPQDMKIPHLRNLYQKVGMFGLPAIAFVNNGNNGCATGNSGCPATATLQPDQVRGFGFLHDGSIDTVFRFHNATVFNGGFGSPTNANCGTTSPDTCRRNVEQFMLAFDSDLGPVVGQQATLTSPAGSGVSARISAMEARAAAGECDLVVKGNLSGAQRGAVRLANGSFKTDRASDPTLTDAQLRALAAPGAELTFTAVPVGSGTRIGIDRDLDGCLDFDDPAPADPLTGCGPTTTSTTSTSTTSTTTTTLAGTSAVLIGTRSLKLKDDSSPPVNLAARKVSFRSATKRDPTPNRIVAPPRGGSDDPTLIGATLTVYNAAGLTTDAVTVNLPNTLWSYSGKTAYRFKGTNPDGPISRITLKPDVLSIRGGKSNWTYTLDEPAQGAVGVRLTIGALTWCADAPAKLSGNPPSSAKNDLVDRFVAQPKTPAPGTCPPLP